MPGPSSVEHLEAQSEPLSDDSLGFSSEGEDTALGVSGEASPPRPEREPSPPSRKQRKVNPPLSEED